MNDDGWQLGPFVSRGEVLGPRDELLFHCPVLEGPVSWAVKDVFNPAAIVHDDRVHLLVRSEDDAGPYAGTSRIGLATSDDGLTFTLEPSPVLFPDRDPWQPWEWPGGCEDPRVVATPEGVFVCLYTAFDGKTSCLFVATSTDLRHWDKHGPAFAGTPYAKRWSKSGSVVTALVDGQLVASRVDDRYWMYWGEGTCFAATSDDLISWTPREFDAGADRYLSYRTERGAGSWDVVRVTGQRVLRPLLFPRPHRFDSFLVEPGPPAVVTDRGIVLIYNGAELLFDAGGAPNGVTYQPGQVLFDGGDPASPLVRSAAPFPVAEQSDLGGQVSGVCFAQGLVAFRGEWLLYYGMGDSRIGCASAPL